MATASRCEAIRAALSWNAAIEVVVTAVFIPICEL